MSNSSFKNIILNMLLAAFALFLNGFGVYLTMHANIGAGPWDVLNLGISKQLGILYGTASISVSFIILFIDIVMKEPIGIAMIIDSIVVGKSVDFFNFIDIVPVPKSLIGSMFMILVGLTIMGYTQLMYMKAALGCGPRDTLLVGLSKRITKIPIGVVSIVILATATLVGYLLGGPVGIGTIMCAFLAGPIMQFAFMTFKFDATGIKHQNIIESFKVILSAD